MGYLGSLSWDPLGRIFSKCAFMNLLSPLGIHLPSNALGSSKKLKIFPRGCVVVCIQWTSSAIVSSFPPASFAYTQSYTCLFGFDSQLIFRNFIAKLSGEPSSMCRIDSGCAKKAIWPGTPTINFCVAVQIDPIYRFCS